MSDIRPNVFPNKEQPQQPINLTEAEKIAAYEAEKAMVTNEIYTSQISQETPQGHNSALEAMRARTEAQLNMKNSMGVVKDPSLSEKGSVYKQPTKEEQYQENQINLRDEQLRKNQEQTANYQRLSEDAMSRNKEYYQNQNKPMQTNQNTNYQPQPSSPSIVTNSVTNSSFNSQPAIDPYIIELSQPNYNAPFDIIPLPSKGKLYRSKKSNIKLAYMTTADENILTSPNLLKSGEFLEILLNRKILEPELRYKDLLPGDRNAIMLWLRATAYGEMYPITILDEFEEPFDTEINLNDLKTIELTIEPDEDGLYHFNMPISKANVRFKLLTCGDVDDIEKMVQSDIENNLPVNNTNTYKLEKMIVEVNGDRNRTMIRDFVNYMRISDSKEFSKFVETIDTGIDLNIEVGTPGGGSVKTFLPLNVRFFWPDINL
jgi:hypothetical protein